MKGNGKEIEKKLTKELEERSRDDMKEKKTSISRIRDESER